MIINTREINYQAYCGEGNIFARIIEPQDKSQVKAVFQIVHGMSENSSRYIDFAEFMASNGFAVYINDNFGHGNSLNSEKMKGYLGKTGYRGLVEDIKHLKDISQNEYPDKNYYILGHSMGSFLTRAFIEKYPQGIKACILSGTSCGFNPAIMKGGIAFSRIVIKLKGDKCYTKSLQKLTTGSYNKNIKDKISDSDWLTRNKEVVKKYDEDTNCGFMFTSSGYNQLMNLLYDINTSKWFKTLSKDINILLISGTEDPVGDYSNGVKKVYNRLKLTNHNVTMKLYEGARHEVLNEINNKEVYQDIINFLNSNI